MKSLLSSITDSIGSEIAKHISSDNLLIEARASDPLDEEGVMLYLKDEYPSYVDINFDYNFLDRNVDSLADDGWDASKEYQKIYKEYSKQHDILKAQYKKQKAALQEKYKKQLQGVIPALVKEIVDSQDKQIRKKVSAIKNASKKKSDSYYTGQVGCGYQRPTHKC